MKFEVKFTTETGWDQKSIVTAINSEMAIESVVQRYYYDRLENGVPITESEMHKMIRFAKAKRFIESKTKKKTKMAYSKKRKTSSKRTAKKPLTKTEFKKLSSASKTALKRALRKKKTTKRSRY